jgi:hypothetical protein
MVTKYRWEDNIKMQIREVCGGLDWVDLAQDKKQVVDYCEYGNEPSDSKKCREFLY